MCWDLSRVFFCVGWKFVVYTKEWSFGVRGFFISRGFFIISWLSIMRVYLWLSLSSWEKSHDDCYGTKSYTAIYNQTFLPFDSSPTMIKRVCSIRLLWKGICSVGLWSRDWRLGRGLAYPETPISSIHTTVMKNGVWVSIRGREEGIEG